MDFSTEINRWCKKKVCESSDSIRPKNLLFYFCPELNFLKINKPVEKNTLHYICITSTSVGQRIHGVKAVMTANSGSEGHSHFFEQSSPYKTIVKSERSLALQAVLSWQLLSLSCCSRPSSFADFRICFVAFVVVSLDIESASPPVVPLSYPVPPSPTTNPHNPKLS